MIPLCANYISHVHVTLYLETKQLTSQREVLGASEKMTENGGLAGALVTLKTANMSGYMLVNTPVKYSGN